MGVKRFCVLLMAVVCVLSVVSTRRVEARELKLLRLHRVGREIFEQVQEKKLAGAVLLISKKGHVVLHTAMGWQDREKQVPMTVDSMFRIASMTKPVTSVAVMKLVEEGKIGLDDPVSKYIPEFGNLRVLSKEAKEGDSDLKTEPVKNPMTVRHLLTHTGGLTYGLFNRPILSKMYADMGVCDGLIETQNSTVENARLLAKVPLLNEPGSAYEYSIGIDVLGAIVEVASGDTLEGFVQKSISGPLKMVNTHFVVPAEKRGRMAAVYSAQNGELVRLGDEPHPVGATKYSVTYPNNDNTKFYSGGAGLTSTASDYHRFCRMMLNHGELDGVRVLTPETVDVMVKNHVGDKAVAFDTHGDGFGFGFGVVSEKQHAEKGADHPESAGTFSWAGFFTTYFWVDPKEEVIGILMTQHQGPGDPLVREHFKATVYSALGE